MNYKEKQAIKYLKADLRKSDMLEMTVHTDNESLRTALNLIEKLQKERDTYMRLFHIALRDSINVTNKNILQDKIIHEMARTFKNGEIFYGARSHQSIIKYFEGKVRRKI